MSNSFRDDPSGVWSVHQVDENTVELSGRAFENRKVRINFSETGPRGSLGAASERRLDALDRNDSEPADEGPWNKFVNAHGKDIVRHMFEAEKRYFAEASGSTPTDSSESGS